MRRRFLAQFGLIAALAVAATAAEAQQWPNRQMTFLYGNVPGGILDTFCRMYAERIQRSVGQSVVMEFKSGAGGAIAAQALTQARPDGHMFMLALGGLHTVSPHLNKLPFDPLNDFELVMELMSFPVFASVLTSSPANSMQDLVALAKTKEKGISFGSPGPGSPMHLMGLLLKDVAGGDMVHIGYRGGPAMLQALLGGEVDFGWLSYSQIRANLDKIRPLAVADAKRASVMPNVPTFAELNYRGIDLDTWFGIITTKGTPRPIVDRLREEFIKAGRDPEIQRRMVEEGYTQHETTPEQFRTLMVADYEKLGAVIRRYNIKLD